MNNFPTEHLGFLVPLRTDIKMDPKSNQKQPKGSQREAKGSRREPNGPPKTPPGEQGPKRDENQSQILNLMPKVC